MLSRRPTPFLSLAAVSLTLIPLGLLPACSSKPGSSFSNSGGSTGTSAGTKSGGQGGAASVNATGTGSGTMSSGSLANGAGGFNPAGTGGNSGAGGMMTCGATSEAAKPVPVAMYIIVDKSGSMASNNKWPDATAAFTAFFNDPSAADLTVALRFWPDGKCDDSGDEGCKSAVPYCQAPQFGPSKLSTPMYASQLSAAFVATSPSGGTPMAASLGGAEKWAAFYHLAHPDEKAVVVLVTDGDPNGCGLANDSVAMAKLVAQGFAASALTFAVGIDIDPIGQGMMVLNAVASAGHTGQPFYISQAMNMGGMELLKALKAIGAGSVGCTFQMPTPLKVGDKIDPQKINVGYTPGMGKPSTIPNAGSFAQCGPAGGWYYDNPAAPKTILLCPATCTQVQADAGAKINIEIGCKTVNN